MRPGGLRLILAAALIVCAVLLAGCPAGDAGDLAASLSKAAATDSQVGGELAQATRLSSGSIPDAAQLDSYATTIDGAQKQVTDTLNGGSSLSDGQRAQASAEDAQITSTQATISTQQTIASDAPTVAPDASDETTIEGRFAKRVVRAVCKKIRRLQNRPEPEQDEAEEDSEAEGELASETRPEERQTVADTLVTDVRTIAGGAEQKLKDAINLNPAVQQAILESAATSFVCP